MLGYVILNSSNFFIVEKDFNFLSGILACLYAFLISALFIPFS